MPPGPPMTTTRRSTRGAPSAGGAGCVWGEAAVTPARVMTPAMSAARDKIEVMWMAPQSGFLCRHHDRTVWLAFVCRPSDCFLFVADQSRALRQGGAIASGGGG